MLDKLIASENVPCEIKIDVVERKVCSINYGFEVARYTIVQTGTPVALSFWLFAGGSPVSVTFLTPNNGASVILVERRRKMYYELRFGREECISYLETQMRVQISTPRSCCLKIYWCIFHYFFKTVAKELSTVT